jgi:hypothetical protein
MPKTTEIIEEEMITEEVEVIDDLRPRRRRDELRSSRPAAAVRGGSSRTGSCPSPRSPRFPGPPFPDRLD